MSVTVYNPTGILHSITVDIGNVRSIPSVVKLTQYDNTLPTIAVKLTNGNQPYKIPEAANVSIRVGKPDKTGVYNPCLGVSADYTTVYFAATEQMCAVAGTLFAIVEVVTAEGTAGTGTFVIKVSENPVNDDTKLSESEIAVFQKIADEAQKAVASISQFETDLSNTMKQSQKAEDTANNALSTANTAKATADSAASTASDAMQTAETTDARLSSIIADGQQTEGNTELIDIRTWWNGNTSPTAGEATRGQVRAALTASDAVADYTVFGEKYEKYTDFTTSENYIQNGVEKPKSSFDCICTSFIPVIPGEILGANYYSDNNTNLYGVNFYDASKKFISGYSNVQYKFSAVNVDIITIPENCYFVRLQKIYSNKNDFLVYKSKNAINSKEVIERITSLINKSFSVNNGNFEDEDKIEILENKFINSDDNVSDAEGWHCTDFISVYDLPFIYITNSEAMYENNSMIFYDAFYNRVAVKNVANNRKRYTLDEIFSISENAKYVRISSIGEIKFEKRSVRFLNDALDSSDEKISNLENEVSSVSTKKYSELTDITSQLNVTKNYIDMSGNLHSSDGCYATDFIDLNSYERFWFTGGWQQLGDAAYAFYDESKQFVDAVEANFGGSVKLHELNFSTFISQNQQRKYIRISSLYTEMVVSAYVEKPVDETAVAFGNVLYGKKYVSCGDSFTAGDFSGGDYPKTEYYDNVLQTWKTYPYFIAKRNNMFLVNEAVSGSTMWNNGDKNAFSLNRYKEIPADADYITLQFGLNDGSAPIGTIDDTDNTTEMGAWNVVLKYIIENHPYAKIGIIISDAWLSSNLRTAIIQCAEAWGIPYLDMRGGEQVPLGIGGKLGISIKQDAITARNSAFQVTSSNAHPNPKAHEYRSTFIENFLRSL